MKLIIFDLDGVLVDAKKIHFEALNKALSKIDNKYIITWQDHLKKYDGLKTSQKLELLTANKKLDPNLYTGIWENKQKITELMLEDLKFDQNI
jgi:beta-phosphoglucomutase-like phosphatase (HAD superfamily)